MTFAIEPFATDGRGYIHDKGIPAIFSLAKITPMHSSISRDMLKKIRSFNGLPFAIHHFIRDGLPFKEVQQGLSELLDAGVIVGYAPLVEDVHCMVAQAENSVLVDENGVVFITTR